MQLLDLRHWLLAVAFFSGCVGCNETMIVVPVTHEGTSPVLRLGLPEKIAGDKMQSGMFYRPLNRLEEDRMLDLAAHGDPEACWNLWVHTWAHAKTSADAELAVQCLKKAATLEKRPLEHEAMKALLQEIEERGLVADFPLNREKR